MGKILSKLTIFFEDPFWVGVFEHFEDGKLSACKVTFGTEPKDYEVQKFILKNYYRLQFSPAVKTVVKDSNKNSKKMKRDVKKNLMEKGIGTKSQQALKLQYEQNKQARIAKKREDKLEREQLLFEMKQQKKKEKHKGH